MFIEEGVDADADALDAEGRAAITWCRAACITEILRACRNRRRFQQILMICGLDRYSRL